MAKKAIAKMQDKSKNLNKDDEKAIARAKKRIEAIDKRLNKSKKVKDEELFINKTKKLKSQTVKTKDGINVTLTEKRMKNGQIKTVVKIGNDKPFTLLGTADNYKMTLLKK